MIWWILGFVIVVGIYMAFSTGNFTFSDLIIFILISPFALFFVIKGAIVELYQYFKKKSSNAK